VQRGQVLLVRVRLAEAVRPASVATSMMARSANGSCTPTEFSNGGSANATGVMVTFVMRMLPLIARPRRGRGWRRGQGSP
jgi:hypothetical protein